LGIFRRDLPLSRSIEHALNLQPGELRRGVPLLHLLAQVPKTFPEATKAARVTALIHCMVSTGFAIRDTIQLERDNINVTIFRDGWLRIKREKTAERFSRNWVVLLSVTNGNPRFVFWSGAGLPTSATTNWQADLRVLMEDAGVWIKGNLSHASAIPP
jgi:hypothetical protein